MTFEEILHRIEELGIEVDAVTSMRLVMMKPLATLDVTDESEDNIHHMRFGIGSKQMSVLFNSEANIFRFYSGDDPLSWPNKAVWLHSDTVGEDVSCAIVFDEGFRRFLPERTCGHVEDSGKVVDLIKRMIT